MDSLFNHDSYLIKRQVVALTGKVRLYSPDGELALYVEQKMFRLKEDIRAYADESRTREILYIQARQILDFSAAYDIYDSTLGSKVGVLRRKGWSSLMQDKWEVMDANDQLIGILQEDNLTRALLRRMLLGALLPQDYDLLIGEERAADLKQRFHLFRYEMDLDFSMDTRHLLDRRIGVAAGILLAVVEGRQDR